MSNNSFSLELSFDAAPAVLFDSIRNVRGWWSEQIDGNTCNEGDEFVYEHNDVHRCKMKLVDVIPGKRMVWKVLENYFSFTNDNSEWVGTHIKFNIDRADNKTILRFEHEGLIPSCECYSACEQGWSQYIARSLADLVNTGKGLPNSRKKAHTVHEVAARFEELAREERWFDIQDELFDNDVKSIEPAHSVYFKDAAGKYQVRKKGEAFVSEVEAVHHTFTSKPLIEGNYFVVAREVDLTHRKNGRMQMNELMMYEVRNGKIISEQFFY